MKIEEVIPLDIHRIAGPAVAALLALSANGPALADNGWQFEITPYPWATSMKGDVGAPGAMLKVSVNFGRVELEPH